MSRIGKEPITLPANVSVNIGSSDITVTGPLGTLNKYIDSKITVRQEGSVLHVENNSGNDYKAKHGLYRQIINNMVTGVSKGFTKGLTFNGVGFKATQNGNDLTLNLGFSHPVTVKAVDGIKLACGEKNTITVSGIDKELVGQIAAKIRALKPVEPYHGYGIYYTNEVVRRKEVKSGKK